MAIPSHYFISGVWKTGTGVITDVLLHVNTSTGFQAGKKTTEAMVIQLLKNEKTVKTVRWDYKTPSWKIGANVMVVNEGNKDFLRSVKDATVEDNLDNMIKMNGYF